MNQIKLLNFADFFFNISKEELDEENLQDSKESNFQDPEQVKVLAIIKENQAELLIEQGRKFKEKYLKLKEQSRKEDSEKDLASPHVALEYRKKTGDEDSVEDSEEKKMELIRKAKEEGKW